MKKPLFIAIIIAGLLSAPTAPATTLTWDFDAGAGSNPSDGSGTWDLTTANWWDGVNNVLWNNGTPDDAVFGAGTAAGNFTVTLNTGITVRHMTFNAGTALYTITGNTLTLSGTPTITTSSDGTISSTLAGTAFFKEGAGTLVLTAENTYTGTTTVNNGVLQLSDAANNAVGTIRGTLTINTGGTVRLTTANALGWGGGTKVDTLNINGGLLDNVASGDNGWGITINLTGGTLQSNSGVSSTGTGQLFSLGGGSAINSLASATTSTIAGRINLREGNAANSLTFTVADGPAATDLLVTAGITEQGGSRNMIKDGAGEMNLNPSVANSYTGSMTVNAGTLTINGTAGDGTIRGNLTINSGGTVRIGTGNRIINTSLITINNGGTLNLNSQGDAIGALTGGGYIIGGGSLDLDMVSGTIQTFSGTITSGTITARGENDNGTGSKQIFTGYSTLSGLNVRRGNSANDVVTLELAGSGTTTISGTINLGLGGSGTAVMNITGDHTLTAVNLSVGEGASQPGTINQSGGTFTVSGLFRPGHYPTETSTYNMSGGVLNLTGVPAGGTEQIGILYLGIDGTAIMNQSGGTISAAGMRLDNRGDTGGTDTYTMTGGTLRLGSSGIAANPSTQVNLGGGTISSSASWSSSVPMTLTGTGGDVTFEPASGHTITLSGVLSSTGGLIKTGNGTLTFSNNNTYTGGTTVNQGILDLSGATGGQSRIRGTATVNAGGELRLSGGDGTGFGYTASAAPSQRVDTLNIVDGLVNSTGGSHLYYATVNMTGGTMQIGGGNSYQFGNVAVNTFASASTATMAGGIVIRGDSWNSLTPNLTFTVADGTAATDLLVSAVIGQGGDPGDVGDVTKNGAGLMHLSAANTYSGGTTVNAGTLTLGVGGATGTIRGTLTVNSGAAVDYTTANAFGYSAGVSVNVLNIVDGTVGGSNFGNHFWNSFQLNMTGGTLTLGGTLNEWHNPTITVNSSANTAQILPVTGSAVMRLRDNTSAVFNVADGSQAVDLLIAVPITENGTSGITKNGAGLMQLTANNQYDGNTTINAGTIEIGASGYLYNAGYNNAAIITVNTGGALVLNSFAYGAAGGTGQLADYRQRRVLDGGLIQVTGNTHASGNNFTVNAGGGTFEYTPAGQTLTLNGNGNGNINTAGALSIGGAGNITINEVVEGGGSVIKFGAGTLTFNGGNTFTGGLVLNSGIVRLIGGGEAANLPVTVNNGSTLDVAATNPIPTWGNAIDATINAGGVINFSAGNHAHLRNVVLNGGTLMSSAGKGSYNNEDVQLNGDVTVGGTVASTINMVNGVGLNGIRTFTVNDVTGDANADLILTGSAAGGVLQDNDSAGDSIVKDGTGTMLLLSPSTYTGNTTINGGTLEVSSTGYLYNAGYNNSAIITVNTGGALVLNSFAYGAAGGTGQLADYRQRRVLDGGLIQVTGNTHASGNNFTVNAGGGTFDYQPSGQTLTLNGNGNGNLQVDGALSIGGAGNIIINEQIDGTGSVIKFGAGTLTMTGSSGNNSYTGVTQVDAGILEVGGSFGGDGAIQGDITVNSGGTYRALQGDIIKNTSLLTINSGGTFDRNGYSDAVGALSGGGYVIGGGGFTVDMVGGTVQTFSGTITAGYLTARGENDNGSGSKQVLTGTSSLSSLNVTRGNSANDVVTLELAGSGTTTVSGGVNVGQTGSGTANLNIAGNHWLTGSSLFVGEQYGQPGNVNQSGGTVGISGQIRLAHWPNETSTYNMTGGTLNSNGGLYIGWDGTGMMTLSGTADVNVTAGAFVQRSSTLTIGGNSTFDANYMSIGDSRGAGTVVQDSGAVTINNGELRVGHYNTTGSYTINDGSLLVTGAGTGAESAGVITIGVDGTGTFNQNGGIVTTQGLYLDSRGATPGTDQYNLTGGTLVLTSALGIKGNATTSTFQVNLGGGTVYSTASWSSTIPMSITGTGGNTTFDTPAGINVNLSGALTGGGGIIKAGAGTLTKSGGSTAIDTTINDGTFHISWVNVMAPNHGTEYNELITINAGGTVIATRENRIGDVRLNGGTLTAGFNQAVWGAYFLGPVNGGQPATVTVLGSTPSTIDAQSGGNIKLGPTVNFNVANVTSDANSDLIVSATLEDQAGGGGPANLTKSGIGTMELVGTHPYTGATTINAGTLLLAGTAKLTGTTQVNINSSGTLWLKDTGQIPYNPTTTYINGGTLRQNSGLSHFGTVTFGAAGGTITGTGKIDTASYGGLTVGNNAVLSPGNSPGTQTYDGLMAWAGGGTYHWEINDWTGTPGADPGWDLIQLNGFLDLSALSSANQFTIEIDSLTLANTAGLPANFDRSLGATFPILSSTLGIIPSFSTNMFVLDSSGFTGGGSYSVWSIYQQGNTLFLQYTALIPEPTTVMLLGLGGLMLLLGRRLRKSRQV